MVVQRGTVNARKYAANTLVETEMRRFAEMATETESALAA